MNGNMMYVFRGFMLLFIVFYTSQTKAQVSGVVIDSRSRKPLDYVNVFYEGKGVGTMTDEDGKFVIKANPQWKTLTISTMGYIKQTVNLVPGKTTNLKIKLVQEPRELQAVTITAKKGKYSRKNNPAVEFMRKVIEHKKINDLKSNDYYSYSKYEKMTFSVNEFTEKVFDVEEGKRFAFLKDHVETCPKTGKLILPLTVDETLSSVFYRKQPELLKELVKAKNSRGINELINTGEILTTTLKDCFTDVNIYDEECRLLQLRFKSPIANSAISFYRYYLQDTIAIENDSVIQLGFLPNNQQDVGFSGYLYVMKDSTYQVRRVELNIPKRSDVNFVKNMIIEQEFEELPTGERVMTQNDMLIELELMSWLSKLQVQRTIRQFDYAFVPVPNSVFKHIKGDVFQEPDATMHTDDAFWNQYRKVELTDKEGEMKSFIDKITDIKGFKIFIFGAKALIENFVETSDSLQNNKFDFGPINTIVSFNDYDKTRFRVSGLTTAHLNPHLFWSGYAAYGTKTKNFYGKSEFTYAFNKKAYLTREFPKNNLHVYYWNDIISPFDKFIPTDKDNMFTSLKTNKVDQYMHTKEFKIMYDREWYDGMKLQAYYKRTRDKAVDKLFFQPLGTDAAVTASGNMSDLQYDPTKYQREFNTSEFKVSMSFEPGATYINTKQRRIKINKDAPIISVSHTIGLNHFLGGDYSYNVTEAGIYKRLYVPSGWGYISTDIKAGIQWNKVPFPLLIHPAANQSYIVEDFTFSLINNLEFLNDRYLSGMIEWDLCGKILNRIPLLKKLQWRELIGFNILWGTLSDKNNPAKSNFTDSELFYFPGHFKKDADGKEYYECNTVVMDKKRPYMELRLGVHNIFKLFHIEYVKRLSYKNNPGVNKDGIRFMFRMQF